MIFKKLFNLIKNNQNFPYFNFKNKFLIERNNKIKNIFTRLNYMFKATSWSVNDSINVDKMYNIKNFFKFFSILAVLVVIYLNIIDFNVIQTLLFLTWSSSNYVEFIFTTVTTVIWVVLRTLFIVFFELFHVMFKLEQNSKINDRTATKHEGRTYNLINYSYLTRYEDVLNLVEFNDTKLKNNKIYEQNFVFLYNILNTQPINTKLNLLILDCFDNTISKTNTNNYYTHNYKTLSFILNNSKLLNKFNLNTENLLNNELKKIEINKWLYKYSTIHSRSFFEAQFLNLKLLPIGNNINKTETLNTNNIFNFLFNDVTSKYFLYNNLNLHDNSNILNNFTNFSYFKNINIFQNLPLNYRFFNLKFKNLTTLFYKNNTFLLKTSNLSNNNKLKLTEKTILFYDYYTLNKINDINILYISNVLFYTECNLLTLNNNKIFSHRFNKTPYQLIK